MNPAITYAKACLHRAINQGDKVMTISTLDLKDVLAELEKLVTRQDPARPIAPLVGWADPEKIQQMRQGQRRYLTVSRKKGETFTQQVCASTMSPSDRGGYVSDT
ncbi:hypothetical protein NJH83_12005 [Pseudomonas chlororaphis]|uniref:hypothetical protein n=1 Tax=Pseudomonas chlororaphis TaxID=587753 RepID=UPI00209AEAAA|nr:hypothetical protein [Pseudomonas chlororaphis]MCO7610952.1 hypothetical protein [Pseudomonas chlororaphis]